MANKINFKLRRRFLDTSIPKINNSEIGLKIENNKMHISLPIETKEFSESDSLFEFRKTLESQQIPVQFNELYVEPIVTKVLATSGNDEEYSSRVRITAVLVVDVKKPKEEDWFFEVHHHGYVLFYGWQQGNFIYILLNKIIPNVLFKKFLKLDCV